nr:hypothetical protein [Yersinia aldovae]
MAIKVMHGQVVIQILQG